MSESTTDEPVDILLVEDNPGDVRLTQLAFSESEMDTRIHVVVDGDEVLDVLHERADSDSAPFPDLVLLDLNLPRVGGLEVLERIRDVPEFAHLPVLILTSSRANEDVVSSYERSANAYLTKPTDPNEFATLAKAVENFWFRRAQLPPISP
ncbi:response regulator [Natrialbaceae archaeon GCM10025810]|uniref:response regulator n=1 Tax=Halovalidus salilacus TaxID=3075124 RepID=UPI003612CD7C